MRTPGPKRRASPGSKACSASSRTRPPSLWSVEEHLESVRKLSYYSYPHSHSAQNSPRTSWPCTPPSRLRCSTRAPASSRASTTRCIPRVRAFSLYICCIHLSVSHVTHPTCPVLQALESANVEVILGERLDLSSAEKPGPATATPRTVRTTTGREIRADLVVRACFVFLSPP